MTMTGVTGAADVTSWDQRTAESAKAYAAFCLYRDMGPERSLLKAWRSDGHEEARSVPGRWQVWANLFDRSGRAAAYDRALAQEQIREAMETRRLEVEAYRTEVISRARELARANTEILEKTLDRLKALNPDEISAGMLPMYLRCVVDVWVKVTTIEGIALGLLDDQGNPLQS